MTNIFLYIDPGSGSYLIQALIAGILGFFFFFKNAWLRFKQFFTGKKHAPEEQQENES